MLHFRTASSCGTAAEDVFVHVSALEPSDISTLGEGQAVVVDVVQGRRGREAVQGCAWSRPGPTQKRAYNASGHRVSLMMRSSWASRAGSSRTIRLSAENCRELSVWGCRHHIRSATLSFHTQGWRARLPR